MEHFSEKNEISVISDDIFEKKVSFAMNSLENTEPSTNLLDKIFIKIQKRKKTLIIRKLFYFGSAALFSIAVLAYSWSWTQAEFTSSGAGALLSLLFTDSKTVLVYWQDYSMYLLETFPVYPIIASLASIMLMLVTIKYIKAIFNNSYDLLIHYNKKTI
jgi:hypothetical protein